MVHLSLSDGQRVKLLAAKSDDLSSIHRVHVTETELTPESCPLPPCAHYGVHAYPPHSKVVGMT